MTTNIAQQQDRFIEQAEYLPHSLFEAWTTEHPEEDTILRKLTHTGAKLIIGPRGSGKTTLILKAYYRLLNDNESAALPIYVNFKASLKLEPLYRTNADAVYYFNQWLLLNVYKGLYDTLSAKNLDLSQELSIKIDTLRKVIGQLEFGQVEPLINQKISLDIGFITQEIEKVLNKTGKTRCVLFLDDAAHAFSSEQQRDFFDFFRQIKSRIISPKAAIYPGVTIYSSTFHIGHDAEEINVWLDPQSDQYITFMYSLLEKRLPAEVYSTLCKNEESLKLVCYAAFGMPRALLNMVRTFFEEVEGHGEKNSYKITFSRRRVLDSIKSIFENTINVFRSLQVKVPIYANFILNGENLFYKSLELIKKYNKGKDLDRQSVSIAITKPLPAEISKVFNFFQYSGLVMPMREVSRGEKGVFVLYALHYAALVDVNAILGKKTLNFSDYTIAFTKRYQHEFTRVSPSNLAGSSNFSSLFTLSLPPCHVCGTPRVNENAKFCLNCGSQLKTISSFESIVSRDISDLDLTKKRVESIKSSSQIRTIKDILMDYENRELRSVPRIGPKWAKRIYSYAEESIA